ncbi:tetratricopeptide repeat-containing sensor histidine kinase [uncultured Aquimarina sp.]|uniref:tetratricopeptide repeat-containing sensor histidine kinase n=1 Tax=uncultured Aquimarina sp. TaxID=575652 RepID=UPI0026362F0A|nr:tetratricopeptide repeat-containing sensor histidine kinase [uncultured Aquimarina sp.]
MRTSAFFYILFLLMIISCTTKPQKKNNEKESASVKNYISNALDTKKDKSERIQNADSAFKILDLTKNDLKKRKKLTQISRVYLDLNDSLRFFRSIHQILKLSKEIKDSSGIAFNYIRLAIFYEKTNKLDSAYVNYKRSERMYVLLNDRHPYQHGRTLLGIAIIQRQVKDYVKSISNTVKAIQKFELDGKANNYLTICYSNLGIVSNNLEEYNRAIEYHLKSVKYAQSLKNKSEREILAFNNIGIVYKNQKKYDKAIEFFDKALTYKDFLNKNPKRKSLLLDNLAYAKFLSGEKTNIIHEFNEAYNIRDSIQDKIGLTTNNLHIARYYHSKNNKDQALKHAKNAETLSHILKTNKELLQSYLLLSEISQGKDKIHYLRKYINLNDSLIKEERIFRNKFALIEFETEEKEEQIKLGKQKIDEVQNQNTIYLLGMLLLVTFIAFIIYFSRQRTRYLAQQNKIVEFQAAYETETRISKRLHDELGNDIFQVMMQYQNDPHDPQITKKLNTAYNKARDISRENSEFEVDETYTEELTDMLTNYTENHSKLILRGIDKINWDMVDKNLKITIYRVLQELMTNMQKHSQADLVAIVFKNEKNKLLIKYSDNGIGIEQEDIKSKNGLRNTEKRVQAIQGNITFDSAKDKGFKAEIKIPV